jgi:hypothetical protein
MRVPQGSTYLKDGIEASRACRVFGLNVDTARLERLVVHNLVSSDDTVNQV